MGFKDVLKVLQEIFPEVDPRALKAVAIEHQKDPDAAVEAVLNEVIPFLAERSLSRTNSTCSDRSAAPSPSPRATNVHPQYNDVLMVDNFTSQERDQPVSNDVIHAVDDVPRPEEEQHGQFYDADEALREVVVSKTRPVDDKNVKVNSRTDVLTSSTSSVVFVIKTGDDAGDDEVSGSVVSDQVAQPHLENLEQGHVDGLEASLDSEDDESFEKEDNSLSNSLISEPFDLNTFDMNKELVGSDAALASHEMVNVEDESAFNLVATRSGQVCSTDLLEEIIADARNNKKTLLSAVETVLNLVKEVEAQEEAAEKATEDASNGGVDTLKRVEDLKQMLQHAKEANDMHSGEVYGEKAILATEVRELHSRLLCMSEERDKSLKISDEMRQSLEERLALAERRIVAAEAEKLEKEVVARESLKQQEAIMEKVVEESNLLKQEAESNANLREFLINRGRVVDTLQGEISVICKDVRLLKERFDNQLPLSKSLTSSQTSCIRASSSVSSSYSKSITSDQVDPANDIVDFPEAGRKVDDSKSCSDSSKCAEQEKRMVDKDADLDGWELFDF